MYKLTTNSIIRLSDKANIPLDEGNTDYKDYLAWLSVEGNIPEPADVPTPPTLTELKSTAYVKIDGEAYKTRLKFITPNKDSTYLAKSIQVDTYIAAGYPLNLTNYGYIKAEIARLGLDVAVEADLHTAADGLVTIRNQWLFVDSLIEEVALVAKTQVSLAVDAAGVETVINTAIASFEGIN